MKRIFFTVALAIAALSAGAQNYPDKMVKLVVPAASGGPNDIIGRLLALKLSETWSQPVVVDNRPGAGGNLGATQVAKAPADGYTLLVTTGSLAVNTTLFAQPGYAAKDFTPIINVASTPNILVTKSGNGIPTLGDALNKFKTTPLSFGSAGAGTTPHLSAAYLLNVLNKLDAVHVPYKGAAPALNGAMTGEVQISSVAMPAALQLIKSGRLTGLAVTGEKRSPALPDVPTVIEAGFPGFAYTTWVGVFAPAGTPAQAVARINADVQKLIEQPDFRARLAAVGFDATGGSVESFDRYFRHEVSNWAQIVRATGAKPD
jgi:tripartite-type tricarboxylate transporter receptor subunit TctC